VLTPLQIRRSKARRLLATRAMLEAVTWSFVSKAEAEHFGGVKPELAPANPIASDLSDMRPTLMPGLMAAVARNLKRGRPDSQELIMQFVAFERAKQGTGASRRLRISGKVPGIVFGAGEPAMIELDHNALYFALKKEAFHSSILDMELAGKTQKVLLRDFQMHPWKQQVLHVDFQRVDETTRLHKKVPLHFSGEENSVAVKTDKCLVSHVATEIEIECLAVQLPEFVSVDLSGLVRGKSLHVSDLVLPEGIKAVKHGTQNPVVVAVTEPKAEEEVVAAPVAAPADDKKKGKGKK
jgi:large subunit ribosomal protein L25